MSFTDGGCRCAEAIYNTEGQLIPALQSVSSILSILYSTKPVDLPVTVVIVHQLWTCQEQKAISDWGMWGRSLTRREGAGLCHRQSHFHSPVANCNKPLSTRPYHLFHCNLCSFLYLRFSQFFIMCKKCILYKF